MPEYKYSKPGGAVSYQTSNPQRVTPVNASSFSGPSGGGGIFPFLPIPSSENPPSNPPSDANESKSIREYAKEFDLTLNNGQVKGQRDKARTDDANGMNESNDANGTGESGTGEGGAEQRGNQWRFQGTTPEIRKQPILEELVRPTVDGYQSNETKETKQTKNVEGLNSLNSPSFTFKSQPLQSPSFRFSGQAVDSPSFRSSGRYLGTSGNVWQRVNENMLPDTSVSFRVAGPDPVQDEPKFTEKPLTTTRTVSMQNVNFPEVPVKQVEQKPSQSGSFFGSFAQGVSDVAQKVGKGAYDALDWMTKYQQDKMEHPLREIGAQVGATFLAAPALAALAPSAAVAPIASAAIPAAASNIVNFQQAAQRVAPTVQKVTSSVAPAAGNVVRLADYAKTAGQVAAGVAGAVALPAAAKTAWNSVKQNYSSQNVKGRL